jgi:flavodoxin
MTDKIMILYFTGTGNSRYVAEKIADKTKGQQLNLNALIKKNETVAVQAEKLVFITKSNMVKLNRNHCSN